MNRFSSLSWVLLLLIAAAVPVLRAESPSPLRFGATLSLSSSSGAFARACAHGIELAIEDVNSRGGVGGRRLQVLIEDFKETDLKQAVSAAHKLINVDKVSALLSNWSEDAEVVAPIAEAHGIISMTLGAGGPRASRFAPSAFRATSSDGELALAGVRDERARGAQRACLIEAQTGYYVDLSRDMLATWRALGGTVAFNEALPYGTTNVRDLVTRLRSAHCDSIFIWASPATIGPLISELRVQHVAARRVLPWFADTPEVLERTRGDNQPYVMYRWSFENQSFSERYHKRFQEQFMRPAGNCYDGVRVLAHVMNVVGTGRSEVRAALLALKNYVGITGPFIITPERERTGERMKKYSIHGGKLVEERS